ncbi:hypothetical protein LC612_35180 [Nostoc sp. CHAB 5834]|nr:hypothetical protein [Nostoc sp. CHAB 5834]
MICKALPDLLEQIEQEIEQVSGDAGYDIFNYYDTIAGRRALATIPPRSNAQIQQPNNSDYRHMTEMKIYAGDIKLVASNGSNKADIIDVLCPKQLCFDLKLFLGVS